MHFLRLRTPAPTLDRNLAWAAGLFVLYIVGQLLPLPVFALRILSPERARLIAALDRVMPPVHFAPVSIAPWLTLPQLLRIAACTLVFLLVRDLIHRSARRPWLAVVPILLLAGLEAALGLIQSAAGAEAANGTYINKNHFAGLLEMALPRAC